jgi:hypothetical protein
VEFSATTAFRVGIGMPSWMKSIDSRPDFGAVVFQDQLALGGAKDADDGGFDVFAGGQIASSSST